MATSPNASPIQHIPEEEGELHINPSLEHAYDQGTKSLAEARYLSGQAVANRVFEFSPEAMAEVSPVSKLEVVTPSHIPRPGARREDTTPAPRKDRDWRSKMAADQPPKSQRPPEWDEGKALKIIPGGKSGPR